MLLSKLKQELLVYGYIKAFDHLFSLRIPLVIYSICLQLYDDLVHTRIMLPLLSPNNGSQRTQQFNLPLITINNIKFNPALIIDFQLKIIRVLMYVQLPRAIK